MLSHGYVITVPELPDFLPLFLEFLSTRPPEVARASEPATPYYRSFGQAFAETRQHLRVGVPGVGDDRPGESAWFTRLKDLLSAAEDDLEDFEQPDKAWEDEPGRKT